jgi:redox-sensitive bicupin YhaK (pirin superfamily)
MLTIRRNAQIHQEQDAGFDLRFHFSFKDYQDPAYDGFGALRLFNDDTKRGILKNRMHPHSDVEVLTYIVEGTFRHEDSLGNSFVLPTGSLECFSTGTGAEHAEHNASETETLRMILMYFVPETAGLSPSVTYKVFEGTEQMNRWRHIAGPPGCDDTGVVIHQQVHLYAATLIPGTELRHLVMSGRGAYLYLIRGTVEIDGKAMAAGDAAMVTETPFFDVEAISPCELLLVDVPLLRVSPEVDTQIKGDVRVTESIKDPAK